MKTKQVKIIDMRKTPTKITLVKTDKDLPDEFKAPFQKAMKTGEFAELKDVVFQPLKESTSEISLESAYSEILNTITEYKIPEPPDLSKEKEFTRFWAKMDGSQLKQLDNVFQGDAAWFRMPKAPERDPKEVIIDVLKHKTADLESYLSRQGVTVIEKRDMKFKPNTDTAWDDHGKRLK
jgi:hypothetical protein